MIYTFLIKLAKGRRKGKGTKCGVLKSLINRDKLNQADKMVVAKTVPLIFSAIQDRTREEQLLALTSAFVLLTEVLRFNAEDARAAVINLMKDPMNASGRVAQFDAMKWHLREDILKR